MIGKDDQPKNYENYNNLAKFNQKIGSLYFIFINLFKVKVTAILTLVFRFK